MCIPFDPTIPLLGIPKETIMDRNKYIPLRTIITALLIELNTRNILDAQL